MKVIPAVPLCLLLWRITKGRSGGTSTSFINDCKDCLSVDNRMNVIPTCSPFVVRWIHLPANGSCSILTKHEGVLSQHLKDIAIVTLDI